MRDEFLRGKPVGVLGNQGACVIAKSYEMKAAGVATGEPIWEAMTKCPGGVYVKRDFRWYEVLSRLMLECLKDLSPRVEYYSIDEFFFEAIPRRGQDFLELARSIRDRMLEVVGVPVTVGLARTRTLAKLISDAAKPFGALAVLDPEGEAALLADRPVTEIAGIAGRRERRLAPWGIRSCLDLARADRRLVRALLTAAGEALWWKLNGEPTTPIRPGRPRHESLSRGGSFGEASTDPLIVYAWLIRNLERLFEELDYHELLAGRLTVWVPGRPGGARPGHADRTVGPVRRSAGGGPVLPAAGLRAASGGLAHAPGRRAPTPPRARPARPVRANPSPRPVAADRPAEARGQRPRRPLRPPRRRHAAAGRDLPRRVERARHLRRAGENLFLVIHRSES